MSMAGSVRYTFYPFTYIINSLNLIYLWLMENGTGFKLRMHYFNPQGF